MPPPEITFLFHDAVLWPYTGLDRYSQQTVGDPVQLKVRWDGSSSMMMAPDGNQITLDATAVVSVDIAIGSRMWLGLLKDYVKLADDSQLMEVKTFQRVDDIKKRNAFRKVGLLRLHR